METERNWSCQSWYIPLSIMAWRCNYLWVSLMASFLQPYLGDAVIAEMTCVGSLLIVALSLNMLGLTKIKVMNLVPAIFLPILLCLVM